MDNSFNPRSVVLWACCLFGGNLVSAASCNADNCLRALFPTQSPAVYSSDAAFCATFTASRDTRTTGFPSKATAACGTAASRYSSACSCKPTLSTSLSTTRTSTSSSKSSTSSSSSTTSSITPTISTTCLTTPSITSTSSSTSSTSSSTSSTTSSTPSPACTPYSNYNDGVINGDFECGLAPWIAEDLPGNTHTISSPGDNSKLAYEFDQTGPISPDTNSHPASLSQDLKTVAGVPYNLRFRTYFDKCTPSEGFVGVMIDHQAVYTIDACDAPAGVFHDNLVQFFASSSTNLRFEFLIFETPAVVKIDNVSVIPLH